MFRDELVVIMDPNHPLASRTWIRAGDFAGVCVIGYTVPPREMSWYRDVLAPAGITPGRYAPVELRRPSSKW